MLRKEMLRKSPASNAKATTLKDADVFLEFFRSYKIGRILALFLLEILFCHHYEENEVYW